MAEMEYEIEELMGIVAELSRKYTSGESSSVTYETANMLMAAVLYCIDEYKQKNRNELLVPEESVKVHEIYKKGYEAVIAKVYQTKALYEEIIKVFHDYGCKNCSDTVLKGIPQFFTRYDARFNPQDHLLTLDYPTLGSIEGLCGVDAIYEYLCHIKMEWLFLKGFPVKNIQQLLQRMMPDYRNAFYGNIVFYVMLTVIGCFLADKSPVQLELTEEDLKDIAVFFKGMDIDEATEKINRIMEKLIPVKGKSGKKAVHYFQAVGRDYAALIINGIENQTLPGVFGIL